MKYYETIMRFLMNLKYSLITGGRVSRGGEIYEICVSIERREIFEPRFYFAHFYELEIRWRKL